MASELFDEVMVSTDDEEIANISISLGAQVPFKRSAKNSDDMATTAEVIFEVLDCYKAEGKTFDYACCIYPTAPLITLKSLLKAHQLMRDNNFNSVFPVVAYTYPIWRALRIAGGKAEMFWPENLNRRSQDLPTAWHDAGQFYWVNVKSFMSEPIIFGTNSGVVHLEETEVQDIDNIIDWKLAELKARLIR